MRDTVSAVYRYVFPYLYQLFRPFLVLKIKWHYPLNLLNSAPSSNFSTTSLLADTKTSTPQSTQCRLLPPPCPHLHPPPVPSPTTPPAHPSPASPAPHASAPCYRRSRPRIPPPAPTSSQSCCTPPKSVPAALRLRHERRLAQERGNLLRSKRCDERGEGCRGCR